MSLALLSAPGTATASSPQKVFQLLQELNNKLGRAINGLPVGRRAGTPKIDTGHWTRTLNDLEATKLSAIDQLPSAFAHPFSESFTKLSCIDENIAVGKRLLLLLGRGNLDFGRLGVGENVYVVKSLHELLKSAKECKDTLETELGASVPSGASGDLRELNNKLDRAIRDLPVGRRAGTPNINTGHWTRTLTDLEATKLRAVSEFGEVFDPLPYSMIFRPLSCIDENIAVGKRLLLLLGRGNLDFGRLGVGENVYVVKSLHELLKSAKECKDTLEVELLHSFDLKPSEQMEVGANQTTPNGTDTMKPSKSNAPKPLEHAYATNGFIGRHEHDYLATGVDGGHPDTWPTGRNVLFFDVFDLFNTIKGAQKVEKASEQNLKSKGFSTVSDTSLGSGEKVFQLQPSGSPLLSTIIYVQRGTFILKIAGSCKGCQQGAIESSLKSLAQVQLAQAVSNGFPTSSAQPGSVAEVFDFTGSGGSGQQNYSVCIYVAGPPGQTGDVQLGPGDATAKNDPNAMTYDKSFALDQNGNTFLKFTEPGDLFAFTINRKESNGSTSTSGSTVDPRLHRPPPWGLPDCTYP